MAGPLVYFFSASEILWRDSIYFLALSLVYNHVFSLQRVKHICIYMILILYKANKKSSGGFPVIKNYISF